MGYEAALIPSIEAVNQAQKKRVYQKMTDRFSALDDKTFALWGLAFKPNTDDMREAPAVALIEQLLAAGAKVRAYDPAATEEAHRIFANRNNLVLCDHRDETLEGADALAILTEWNEFRSPDFDLLRTKLVHPVIFDGRNLFEPSFMSEIGFEYYAIGRTNVVLSLIHI